LTQRHARMLYLVTGLLLQSRPPTCSTRRLCNTNNAPIRLLCAVRSCLSCSSSRCARRASSSCGVGTRTTDQTRRSPPEVAQQHRQQLATVEAIGLGPPGPAIDFDAGRVHHDVVDTLRKKPAVQPEAVAARFVATAHHSIAHQTTARLGLGDRVQHRPLIARVHRVAARSPPPSLTTSNHFLSLSSNAVYNCPAAPVCFPGRAVSPRRYSASCVCSVPLEQGRTGSR
jgi:hypothetical protein